jgi:hypothetical protein
MQQAVATVSGIQMLIGLALGVALLVIGSIPTTLAWATSGICLVVVNAIFG